MSDPVARAGRLWRVALSGSSAWPDRMSGTVFKGLDEQLAWLRPGDTFVLRWGKARRGVDHMGALWFGLASRADHGVIMIAEPVEADWHGPCVTAPYADAHGQVVKACPPGHRKAGRDGKTYCPSAGHRRNPSIVAHPEYPVNYLLAYCQDDSSGTTATVEHARRHRVNHRVTRLYSPRPPETSPAARDDRGPGEGEG